MPPARTRREQERQVRVSVTAEQTTSKAQTDPNAEPPIVCALARGTRTWRFVFPRRSAADALHAAREIADRGELDAFDIACLDLLIRRALRNGDSRCTTVMTPHRRPDASDRDPFISRTTWSKD